MASTANKKIFYALRERYNDELMSVMRRRKKMLEAMLSAFALLILDVSFDHRLLLSCSLSSWIQGRLFSRGSLTSG